MASEEIEPASPTARLMQRPGFDLCIFAVMGYMTTIDVGLYKKELELTFMKHPRFSSILVKNKNNRGKLSWKHTKTDIENHVFAPNLDPDMDSPDKFVENYISSLSKKNLDPTKPLWEVHVLNLKTSDANSTAIFKIDHSIGDGVSLISLVLACAQKTSDPESLPVLPSKKKKAINTENNGFMMKRLFLFVWTMLLVVVYTLIDCTIVVATILFLKDTKTPIKGRPGVEVSSKKFVHQILDLEDVKIVKNAMHVSVNDVLLGVTEAGLSRYLNMRYEKLREQNGTEITKKSSNFLPTNIRFRTAIAFNLRPSPTIQDLIEVIEEKKGLKGMWGNLVGFLLVPLTIALRDDPLVYIHRAKASMDRKKLSLEPYCVFLALKIIIKLFGTKVGARITGKVFYSSTFGFSNVMGPKEEVILFGHPLCYISPTVSGFPQALVIHYQTYANKLVIALACDENLIPNPHQLCDDLQKSLQNIKETVIKRGLVKDTQLC